MLRANKRHTTPITLPPDAHILVVKLATIGDLLLATPALRALRETYPQAQIDLLVTPASAGLLNTCLTIRSSCCGIPAICCACDRSGESCAAVTTTLYC